VILRPGIAILERSIELPRLGIASFDLGITILDLGNVILGPGNTILGSSGVILDRRDMILNRSIAPNDDSGAGLESRIARLKGNAVSLRRRIAPRP